MRGSWGCSRGCELGTVAMGSPDVQKQFKHVKNFSDIEINEDFKEVGASTDIGRYFQ